MYCFIYLLFVVCVMHYWKLYFSEFCSTFQSTLRRLQQSRQETINEKNVLQGKIDEIKTSAWVVINATKIHTNHTCFLVKWNVSDMHSNLYWQPLMLLFINTSVEGKGLLDIKCYLGFCSFFVALSRDAWFRSCSFLLTAHSAQIILAIAFAAYWVFCTW